MAAVFFALRWKIQFLCTCLKESDLNFVSGWLKLGVEPSHFGLGWELNGLMNGDRIITTRCHQFVARGAWSERAERARLTGMWVATWRRAATGAATCSRMFDRGALRHGVHLRACGDACAGLIGKGTRARINMLAVGGTKSKGLHERPHEVRTRVVGMSGVSR